MLTLTILLSIPLFPLTATSYMPGDSLRRKLHEDILLSLNTNDFTQVEENFDYPHGGLLIGNSKGIQYETSNGWIDNDTPYQIASQSKLLSALAIFQVTQRIPPPLTLNSTVQEFFPSWPNSDAKINLSHFLSFTSGIHYDTLPGCARETETQISWEDCITEIGHLQFPYPPGSSFNYGPWHLVVAAGMVQKALGRELTHEGWALTVREGVFEPAGVTVAEGGTGHYPGVDQFGSENQNSFPDFSGGMKLSGRVYGKIMEKLYFGELLSSTALTEFDFDRTKHVNAESWNPAGVGGMRGSLTGFWHYSFGHWIACDELAEVSYYPEGKTISIPPGGFDNDELERCEFQEEDQYVLHSVGLWGFYAWVDKRNEYYGVFVSSWPINVRNSVIFYIALPGLLIGLLGALVMQVHCCGVGRGGSVDPLSPPEIFGDDKK